MCRSSSIADWNNDFSFSATADQSEHDWKSDNKQSDESSITAATARDGPTTSSAAAESIYEPTTSECAPR